MKSTCKASPFEVVEYYKTHTVVQTTKHFGIGAETVSRYCSKVGFKKRRRPNTKRKPSKEELQYLASKYSNAQIGKQLEVHESTVSTWMRESGLRRNAKLAYRQADPNEAIRISRLHRFTVGHEYEYSFIDDNHVDRRTERTERGICVADCQMFATFWNGRYNRTVPKVCLQIKTPEYRVKELS